MFKGNTDQHPMGLVQDSFISFDESTFEFKAKIQLGARNEVGWNGCQVDEIIEFTKEFIEGLNSEFPCRENSLAITKLEEALMWLNKRKRDREDRGVEGYNKV